MIVFAHPVALLLAIPAVLATTAIWATGFSRLSPFRRWLSLGLRLFIVGCIVLALSGLAVRLPQNRQAVIFLADLSASDAAARAGMRELIAAALARRPAGDSWGSVAFGRDALVEQPVTSRPSFGGFSAPVDAQDTNLASGLDLAAALLPAGDRRRVVLLSDGRQTIGDALTSARLLRAQGVRVDVVPIAVPHRPEVLVQSVSAPPGIRPRERFSLAVTLRSNLATSAYLSIFKDQVLVSSQQVVLKAGDNSFQLPQPPLRPGFHTFTAHISPAADTVSQNNSLSTFTWVAGPPRVLVIAASTAKAANVVASLRSTGVPVDLRRPPQVPASLTALEPYASVVIVDTPASQLRLPLMRQLIPFVRNLGHGLVVTGGDASYGMGGYAGTPLEQLLPVKMELPKRRDVPSVAVVLLIESLETDQNIDISKEAAKGIVQLLEPQDLVAVNDTPDDGTSGWVVKLHYATDKAAISRAISRMDPGDPLSYLPYLQAARTVLLHAPARLRHVILLGDGDATDSYKSTLLKIRQSGITVSTIATDDALGMGEPSVMRHIAEWGGGRYYRAHSFTSVPQIFLREARTVGRSSMISGKFYPKVWSPSPMLHDLSSAPPLYGYDVTRAKPTGEVALVSRQLDPVLAAWQFGLGRTVAWTSDASGLWTRDWLRSSGARHFWSNLVSWSLPTAGSHLFVSAGSSHGQARISVDTPPEVGTNPAVRARMLDPQQHLSTLPLAPSAAGQYEVAFSANHPGAYFITVDARGDGRAELGQAGLAVPYSDEYRGFGVDARFLHAVAAAGGGGTIRQVPQIWQDNLPVVYARRSLDNVLWLLALLLLPVDVALRRLVLGRPDLSSYLRRR